MRKAASQGEVASDESRDETALAHYFDWASARRAEFTGRIHTEKFEQGEGKVGRADGTIRGNFAVRICGTDDLSAAHTTAGDADKAGARPVVATSGGIQLWRPAKFAHHHD